MKWTVQSSIWLLYLIPASLHWADKDVFPFVWLTKQWELWPDGQTDRQTPVQFVEGTNMSIWSRHQAVPNTIFRRMGRVRDGGAMETWSPRATTGCWPTDTWSTRASTGWWSTDTWSTRATTGWWSRGSLSIRAGSDQGFKGTLWWCRPF